MGSVTEWRSSPSCHRWRCARPRPQQQACLVQMGSGTGGPFSSNSSFVGCLSSLRRPERLRGAPTQKHIHPSWSLFLILFFHSSRPDPAGILMLMLIPNCSANNRPHEEERESGQTKLRTMKSFTTQTRSKSEQDQIAVQESVSLISQIPVGLVEFQSLNGQARAL